MTNEKRRKPMTCSQFILTVAGVFVLFGLAGCEYPKNIKVLPEPWQTLAPGKPMEKFPRVKVLTTGDGSLVEPGDLVQIHVFDQSHKREWLDQGAWWLWIGFATQKETAFFSYEPGVASALVGMQQGTIFEFLEPREGIGSGPQYAGKLWTNPFGDTQQYSWRNLTNASKFISLSVSDMSRSSKFEVQRVCKGKLQYRTVRLFADGPVRVYGESSFYTSYEPREAWYAEAKIEAKCPDGKTATFQYGPADAMNGKAGRSPVIGFFDRPIRDAWDKIPKGVQLK